jgi:addiction module RelB/DinJ family antitoxin
MTSPTDTPLRTATLQFRVAPAVKHASRDILHRIGLTMTQAIELFLQRMIVDQKLPFEVVALDEATMARIGRPTEGRVAKK